MDRKQLKKIFLENNIPEDLYSLDGGLPSESYCMEKCEDKWRVYYSERGIKRSIGCFESEDEACRCLNNEITKIINID